MKEDTQFFKDCKAINLEGIRHELSKYKNDAGKMRHFLQKYGAEALDYICLNGNCVSEEDVISAANDIIKSAALCGDKETISKLLMGDSLCNPFYTATIQRNYDSTALLTTLFAWADHFNNSNSNSNFVKPAGFLTPPLSVSLLMQGTTLLYQAFLVGKPELAALFIRVAINYKDAPFIYNTVYRTNYGTNFARKFLPYMLTCNRKGFGDALVELTVRQTGSTQINLVSALIHGVKACDPDEQVIVFTNLLKISGLDTEFNDKEADTEAQHNSVPQLLRLDTPILAEKICAKMRRKIEDTKRPNQMVEEPSPVPVPLTSTDGGTPKTSLSVHLQNISIVFLNAFIFVPILLVTRIILSLFLILAKSLWIAIGVPIFYGVGNFVRMLTLKQPVRAPIGFVQWLMHAALLTSLIVFPLAFAGTGVFAGSLLAQWITSLPGLAAVGSGMATTLVFTALSTTLVCAFIGWPDDSLANQSYISRLYTSVATIADALFVNFISPEKNNAADVTNESDIPTSLTETESVHESFIGWDFTKGFYNSSCSTNLFKAHQTWRTSLSELTDGFIPKVKLTQ